MNVKILLAASLATLLCAAPSVTSAQEGLNTEQAIALRDEVRRSDPIVIFATEGRSRPDGLSDTIVAALDRRPVVDEKYVTLDAAGIRRAFNPNIPVPYTVPIQFINDIDLMLTIERVEVEDQTRRITGRILLDDLSQVSLVISGPYMLGTVQSSSEIFEFIPTVEEVTAVVAVDHRRYPRERKPGAAHRRPEFRSYSHPAEAEVIPTGGSLDKPEPIDGEPYADSDYSAPEINVLVLASEHEFDCDDEWLEDMAELYKLDLDFVFGDLLSSDVKFMCVDVLETWNDIEIAYEEILGHNKFGDWRKNATADIVVYLMAHGLGYCGYSKGPDYPQYPIAGSYKNYFAEFAVLSMVADECAIGNKSLAHEIGHLFGMKHERFSERGGVGNFCGYGYPIMKGCKPTARTIMAYDSYCTFVNGVSCKRASTLSIPGQSSVASIGGGSIKGQTCNSKQRDHLGAPANNTYQLVVAAEDVAGYWELFSGGGT